MTLNKVSDIFLALFVIISIYVYIIFITTLLLNRSKEPFNSAFFTLVISLGFADIAYEFHTYIFIKSAGWGWLKDFWLTYGSRGSFLAFYGNALEFAMALCQYLGILFLSINRFTAIIYSTKHSQVWTSRNVRIAIALQWIIPVIFVLPMSLSQFEYTFYISDGIENNGSISVIFCDDDYMTVYYICSTLIQFVITASTCCFYVAVFVSAMKQASKNSNSTISLAASSVSNHQRELRFAISGFLLFVVLLAYFVHLILIVITGDPNFDDGLMYNIVCDLLSCINPYTLLIMSKPMRTAFMRTLKCGH